MIIFYYYLTFIKISFHMNLFFHFNLTIICYYYFIIILDFESIAGPVQSI